MSNSLLFQLVCWLARQRKVLRGWVQVAHKQSPVKGGQSHSGKGLVKEGLHAEKQKGVCDETATYEKKTQEKQQNG